MFDFLQVRLEELLSELNIKGPISIFGLGTAKQEAAASL